METNLTLAASHSTSSLEFLWRMTRNPLDALTDLANEQGDIARVKVGKREVFLLAHPEFIELVLVKQAHNFVKGRALQRARILLGEGLLTSEGPEHLVQRRALQPAFHRQRMEEYAAVMGFSTLNEISTWQDGQRVSADLFFAESTVLFEQVDQRGLRQPRLWVGDQLGGDGIQVSGGALEVGKPTAGGIGQRQGRYRE